MCFALALPLIIHLWSLLKKETSIQRLLSIYWKITSLLPISILLLSGNKNIGYLTFFLTPYLMVICLWLWIDLNEELTALPPWRGLALTVKIWRWIIAIFAILITPITGSGLNCIKYQNSEVCSYIKEAPESFHSLTSSIFKFLFGANWNEPLAGFVGVLGLIVYVVGLLQWVLTKMLKQGRVAGEF